MEKGQAVSAQEQTPATPTAATFRVIVMTPEGTLHDGPAERLELSTLDGIMEILPRHEAVMAPLGIAPMTLTPPDPGDPIPFAVIGGFLDLSGPEAAILADAAEKGPDIDIDRAQRALDRARERLAEVSRPASESSVDIDRAKLALLRSMTRLEAAGQPPHLGG